MRKRVNLEPRHHTALVPADVIEALKTAVRVLRIDSLNSAAELALEHFRHRMADSVYESMAGCARFADSPLERLQLRLPADLVQEIETAYERTPIGKMRIVGVLLGGNLDNLQNLIAEAIGVRTTPGSGNTPANGPEETTTDGRRRKGTGAAAAAAR